MREIKVWKLLKEVVVFKKVVYFFQNPQLFVILQKNGVTALDAKGNSYCQKWCLSKLNPSAIRISGITLLS